MNPTYTTAELVTVIAHKTNGYTASVKPFGSSPDRLSARTLKKHFKKAGDMDYKNYTITEPAALFVRFPTAMPQAAFLAKWESYFLSK